jgi:hypothetical protein
VKPISSPAPAPIAITIAIAIAPTVLVSSVSSALMIETEIPSPILGFVPGRKDEVGAKCPAPKGVR